jgi:predicted DNA-binding transcriptional regulator AlpA
MTDKTTDEEKLYKYLLNKYKKMVISKQELGDELGVGKSTIDLYISKNEGIPPYKKLGKAKNAKVVFNILEVAKFLNNTIATN